MLTDALEIFIQCSCSHTCSLLHLHQDKGSGLAGGVQLPMSLHPSITVRCTYNLEGDVLPVNERKQTYVTFEASMCNNAECFKTRPKVYSQVFLDLGVVEATSDQPLGGVQCVLRVGDSLAFSGHAHQTFPISGEGDD